MSDGEPGARPAPGGGNPLVAWCRHLEARLAGSGAESQELVAENDRLRARVEELTAALKTIQNAYLLGKLRAAGRLPAEFTRRSAAAPPPATPAPEQPITEVMEQPPETGEGTEP